MPSLPARTSLPVLRSPPDPLSGNSQSGRIWFPQGTGSLSTPHNLSVICSSHFPPCPIPLVPRDLGNLTLLNPLAWRYHSLMLFSVLFLVKSNMNNIATASLHTRGNMFTNSRWPPRSQIEKVISVLRMEMVFSMKFTPAVGVVVSWANLSFSVSPRAGEDSDWKSGGVCGELGIRRGVK